jgi:16S rRNA processing protein RimM
LSQVSPEDLLLVGKVTRPHGLDGRLRVLSFAQSEETFLRSGTVFLGTGSGETRSYNVSSIRPHKNIFLLKLKGLDSLEEAEKYRGASVFIEKDTLAHKDEEEYFWYELIGLSVHLNTGQYLGTIRQIIPTGSNDIYVVREGDREHLIPATHEVVKEIDLAQKKMIICEKEGLFDLNEV